MDFKIHSILPGQIKTIHELIKTIRIRLSDVDQPLYVKVFKDSDSLFYAVPNYFIGTNTIDAYIYNPNRFETMQEALDEIFTRALLHFYPNKGSHKVKSNPAYYEDQELLINS